MPSAYHSTHDLCDRFRCSSRTLFRRMKRPRNPFPPPCIRHAGSCNLWDAAEVAAWEARERDHARGRGGPLLSEICIQTSDNTAPAARPATPPEATPPAP